MAGRRRLRLAVLTIYAGLDATVLVFGQACLHFGRQPVQQTAVIDTGLGSDLFRSVGRS